jgi:hypothetical protein
MDQAVRFKADEIIVMVLYNGRYDASRPDFFLQVVNETFLFVFQIVDIQVAGGGNGINKTRFIKAVSQRSVSRHLIFPGREADFAGIFVANDPVA